MRDEIHLHQAMFAAAIIAIVLFTFADTNGHRTGADRNGPAVATADMAPALAATPAALAVAAPAR